jgi:hypothetical protein
MKFIDSYQKKKKKPTSTLAIKINQYINWGEAWGRTQMGTIPLYLSFIKGKLHLPLELTHILQILI